MCSTDILANRLIIARLDIKPIAAADKSVEWHCLDQSHYEEGQQITTKNANNRAVANLALPAILWYCCHHWLKAESMISFITGVTHQHFVIITRLPTQYHQQQ